MGEVAIKPEPAEHYFKYSFFLKCSYLLNINRSRSCRKLYSAAAAFTIYKNQEKHGIISSKS